MKVKARTRNLLMSADYSAQEIKVMAQLCQDKGMIETLNAGKDLYSEVASAAFHTTYENCLEFFPKGTPIKRDDSGKWVICEKGQEDKLADGSTDTNKDGKSRRSQAKTILLGMLYGRGDSALANQLECSLDEAKEIKAKVYTSFPAIKKFEDDSKQLAYSKGYVTTLWGRKRRLPDLLLPDFEFFYKPNDDKDVSYTSMERVPDIIADGYNAQLVKCTMNRYLPWKEKIKRRNDLITKFKDVDGIIVKQNGGIKADADRQVVNARVQGSAADMSKKALVKIDSDDRLNALHAHAVVPVHDEVLIQSPLRYARVTSKCFKEDMETAASDKLHIKIRCDLAISDRWYGEETDLDSELSGLKD